MKIAMLIPAAALALLACEQENANNAAADPATADLTMESDPAAADQAINRTDQQSDLGNAADEAVNSVSNAVE